MDTSAHNISSLFEQLGLAADEEAIRGFVRTHRPLAAAVSLDQAEFWSAAQAAFLREAIAEDSDWAEVVDELDAMLRSSG